MTPLVRATNTSVPVRASAGGRRGSAATQLTGMCNGVVDEVIELSCADHLSGDHLE